MVDGSAGPPGMLHSLRFFRCTTFIVLHNTPVTFLPLLARFPMRGGFLPLAEVHLTAIFLSVWLSVSVSLSLCLSVRPSVCLSLSCLLACYTPVSVSLSLSQPVCQSACPSISPAQYPTIAYRVGIWAFRRVLVEGLPGPSNEHGAMTKPVLQERCPNQVKVAMPDHVSKESIEANPVTVVS